MVNRERVVMQEFFHAWHSDFFVPDSRVSRRQRKQVALRKRRKPPNAPSLHPVGRERAIDAVHADPPSIAAIIVRRAIENLNCTSETSLR